MKYENEVAFNSIKKSMNDYLMHNGPHDVSYITRQCWIKTVAPILSCDAEYYTVAILDSIVSNNWGAVQDKCLEIFLTTRIAFINEYSKDEMNELFEWIKKYVIEKETLDIVRDVLTERIASKGGNPAMIEWFMSEDIVNKILDNLLTESDAKINSYVRGLNERIDKIILIGNPRLLKETSADNFSQLLFEARSNVKNTFDAGGSQGYLYLSDKTDEVVDNIQFDGLAVSYIAILTNRIMSGFDSQLEEAVLKFAAISREYKKRYGEKGFKDSVKGIIDSKNTQMCIDTIRNHFRQYIANNNIFDNGNLKNLFDKLVSIQSVPDIESEISSYFNCIQAIDLCVKEPY